MFTIDTRFEEDQNTLNVIYVKNKNKVVYNFLIRAFLLNF